MNFIQRAVTGLEKRLDEVLLESEEKPHPERTPAANDVSQKVEGKADFSSVQMLQPSSSSSRMTMQERLAVAVAKGRSGSSASNSRGATPRSSSEISRTVSSSESKPLVDVLDSEKLENGDEVVSEAEPSTENVADDGATQEGPTEMTKMPARELRVLELEKALSDSEAQRLSEAQMYSERIDALEEKVTYLAKEAAEAASLNKGAASTDKDKKLAEAQEKVALLMEEGERLSKKELQHMTVIKRLRAAAKEDDRIATTNSKRIEALEQENTTIKQKLKLMNALERQCSTTKKELAALQKENQKLSNALSDAQLALSTTRTTLELELKSKEEDQRQASIEALALERASSKRLREELTETRVQANSTEKDLRAKIEELQNQLAKETSDSKLEISILENKLEVLRAKLEEASSEDASNTHAKLLRQIETLQTQYIVASENWQRIEETLQSRLTALESERDDATRREAELRKKARELVQTTRRVEHDLEQTSSVVKDLREELGIKDNQLEEAKRAIALLENRLLEARESERVFQNGTPGKEELQSPPSTDAKLHDNQAKASIDDNELNQNSFTINQVPASPIYGLSDLSYARPRLPRIHLAEDTSGNGIHSPNTRSEQGETAESQPWMSPEPVVEDAIYGAPSPGRFTTTEMSVSTVGAGPSVQLIERISANVRRLESEMAICREEIALVSAQRDEARTEIVELIREIEQEKNRSSEFQQLQEQFNELQERHKLTLEMLGEKSELVEELRDDVADIKQMYRELVNESMPRMQG